MERTLTDTDAVDAIYAAMDATEWDADLWNRVAEIVLLTGRAPFAPVDGSR